ncbi:L-2-hydroxyglutarate oxidase [Corynebacterium hiratae]|uniref:L-2-hydroxyglutarate oxidase n=1 Tax=Corynebacterium hiratae TaxID=3139423 RepID=A0A553G1P4_9CORY|nr:L-2-hydroxyglutarate oxidase [Corynebacterium aurimucosum]TRX63427.1 L-2-hydroxyglutarate oxidase [Corynebacterium aurimucosum]
MSTSRFGVIGAGIIGAAVAREITLRFPGAEVTVLEKGYEPAEHQTGHNSGVVHAGLYYEPGSLKARLCRRGVELIKQYAQAKGVAYDECGKTLVATTPEEEERLREIFRKATDNGVPGVRLLNGSEITSVEPNAKGTLALHSPETAIIDYPGITRALIADIREAGGTVKFGEEVISIDSSSDRVAVKTKNESFEFDYLIACAGLQSDRVAKMAGGDEFPKIVPFFGQYMQLAPKYEGITNGLVYPVPDPAYPFLGVHLTKRVDGAMLVGPNAFLSFGRENYSGVNIGIKDTLDIAFNFGFWQFAAKNMLAAVREMKGLLSRQQFVNGAAGLVPGVMDAEAKPLPRGVRAQAMDKDGTLVDDFVIEYLGNSTLIRNAPSPGATSSLAIAEYIVEQVSEKHDL